jgi:hypothetical protein
LYIQKFYPHYSDGSQMGIGDELEVSYPDLHGIPHRGLVYQLTEGPLGVEAIEIIHNSKRGGGVCIVSWDDFAQGLPVRLRRRPSSPDHARQIIALAESVKGHPYDAGKANCEHFTDWCYNGGTQAKSETLQAGILVGSLGLLAVVAIFSEQGAGR